MRYAKYPPVQLSAVEIERFSVRNFLQGVLPAIDRYQQPIHCRVVVLV